MEKIDVLVIGAGQAGLAMGYYLKQTNRSFVLVDSNERIGDGWRKRYDSLVLFSPRSYSSLPGLALPGDPNGFASKDEIANYLEKYAESFSIPVQLNTRVDKLEQMNEKFKAITSQLDYIADRVVIATGPFQKPFIPELPGALSERIFQMHSSEYRRPSQLPKGSILVIGAGNSGVQIAAELTESRRVYLSTGHDLTFLPQNLLNRSIFWWLDKTRLSRVSSDSKLARFLQKTEPIIGTELKSLVNSEKVHIKERTVSFHDQKAVFKDGLETEVDSIIWATGFQFDFSWIQIPGVLDQKGKPIHRRGISPVTGIYFLGLPWLSRSGSAQLNGIGHDAKYLWEYLS